MPKSRTKTRVNKKANKKEELLDQRNYCGINDPTPFLAVNRIRSKEYIELQRCCNATNEN